MAYQRLNMMLADEFAYHRGNTLLVRKMSGNFVREKLPMANAAGLSMRLQPNYSAKGPAGTF